MRKPKLSLNFRRYSDPVLVVVSSTVATAMTDNPNFTDPIPLLPAFKSAVANYRKALTDAMSGGKDAVATKNADREILEQMCVQLALFVMYVANGDRKILISSRFPLCKEPETAIVGAPMGPTLKNGITSGEVICKVKLVHGAYGYQFHVCREQPTENILWEITPTPRSKFTFRNLQSGKKYWFKVVAVGGNEQRVSSPVSYTYVL